MKKERSYPLLKNLKFAVLKGFIKSDDVFLLLSLLSQINICFFESKLNILHIGYILKTIDIIFSLKLGLFLIFIYDNFFLIIISNGFLNFKSSIFTLILFDI